MSGVDDDDAGDPAPGRRRREPAGQPAAGGTPTPTTTRPSTARSWATWTSCWCPEGLREADARLLGDVRRAAGAGARLRRGGRRPLAGRPGRPAGRAGPVRRHAAPRRPRPPTRTGVRVPLVQADALALPFADAAFDIACTAFGAMPFVADSAAVMREVLPGAAARRALGLLGHPPDALDLPRRPGRGRPDAPCTPTSTARPYVEQDERRRGHLRRAAPHPRRPDPRTGRRRVPPAST